MVSERVSNMESFIEGLLHTAAEVEENVKQVRIMDYTLVIKDSKITRKPWLTRVNSCFDPKYGLNLWIWLYLRE